VTLDSVPPNRRRAYEFLHSISLAEANTTVIAGAAGMGGRVMRKRVCQNVNRPNKTSSYAKREIISIISLRPASRSSNEVALLGRSPRRLFECPCNQCQGYAANDPGETYPDDV
jgi:hypothetical protein